MPFQKGQSGNLKGRPAMDPFVREFARAKSLDAIKRVAMFINHENPDIAMKACNAILDRAWGKPTQPVSGDDEMPAVQLEGVLKLVRPGTMSLPSAEAIGERLEAGLPSVVLKPSGG